ncbi:small ribosomal subunit protein uS7m-like [Physella acuta]|uniref:small ribosomal subunit protein uS7m-like n=1 Tax=Physella acuta TaxID=109671 RepID=UPI0027DCE993|nr:small ribosomal subunit protein uS7m-like [Physella acuta]
MKGRNKERVREVMRRLFENMKHLQIETSHKALEIDRSQIECNPVTIFKQAVDNCKPLLITVRVVKGGVAYRGKAVRKKQELHKMCESNRAYAQLR